MFSRRRRAGIASELSRRATLEVSPKKSKSRPTGRKSRRRTPAWAFSLILHFSVVALLSFFGLRGDQKSSLSPGSSLEIALDSGLGRRERASKKDTPGPAFHPVLATVPDSRSALAPTANPGVALIAGAGADDSKERSISPQAGGESSPALSYFAQILSRIERLKEYPRQARLRREEGLVEVSLLLQRNGVISEILITQSATPSLDRAVLEAIQAMGPLPAPPAEMSAPNRVRIPIRFSLHSRSKK